MSVLTMPVTETVEDVDDELDHIVCCDEDVTMCGRYLPGDAFMDLDIDAGGLCEVCEHKERLGLPCADPGCPKRGGEVTP